MVLAGIASVSPIPPCARAFRGQRRGLPYSAANDFWGKTFRTMSGEAEMTNSFHIVTGCSAGVTKSFVVDAP